MAATKRARVARAMVTAMRVVDDEVGEGDDEKDGGGDEGGVRRRGRWRGKSNGNEGGGQAMATRAMETEGEQQSTSNGIDKGRRLLARERRGGDHTTMTVGDNERR